MLFRSDCLAASPRSWAFAEVVGVREFEAPDFVELSSGSDDTSECVGLFMGSLAIALFNCSYRRNTILLGYGFLIVQVCDFSKHLHIRAVGVAKLCWITAMESVLLCRIDVGKKTWHDVWVMPTPIPLNFSTPRCAMPPKHFADLTPDQRITALADLGLPKFRANQLAKHYYGRLEADPRTMTDLPAAVSVLDRKSVV